MASFAENPTAVPPATTVFVGNLPWLTKEDELRDYMMGAGTVASVSMQVHEDTGRSKGWGLVEYTTPEEAQFAIQQYHEQDFQGRNLNVRLDRSDLDKLGGVTVFVGNLPWSCKDADLATIFASFQPLDVHVKTFQSGKSRGFGLALFADEAGAQSAIEQMNGYNLDGRDIEVREDRPRPEGAPLSRPKKVRAPKANAGQATDQPAPRSFEPSNTLYVSNLSWQSTDDDLFQHFSTSGAIPISAKVQVNDKTSRSKGWGLVSFATVDEAERAKDSLHRTELDERPISVRFDAGGGAAAN